MLWPPPVTQLQELGLLFHPIPFGPCFSSLGLGSSVFPPALCWGQMGLGLFYCGSLVLLELLMSLLSACAQAPVVAWGLEIHPDEKSIFTLP